MYSVHVVTHQALKALAFVFTWFCFVFVYVLFSLFHFYVFQCNGTWEEHDVAWFLFGVTCLVSDMLCFVHTNKNISRVSCIYLVVSYHFYEVAARSSMMCNPELIAEAVETSRVYLFVTYWWTFCGDVYGSANCYRRLNVIALCVQ
jgi:hypothetical protein